MNAGNFLSGYLYELESSHLIFQFCWLLIHTLFEQPKVHQCYLANISNINVILHELEWCLTQMRLLQFVL